MTKLSALTSLPLVHRYMMSFYSLVDLLAIVPWYLARVSTTVDQYDHTFRLIRILRLLTLDKYYPGQSALSPSSCKFIFALARRCPGAGAGDVSLGTELSAVLVPGMSLLDDVIRRASSDLRLVSQPRNYTPFSIAHGMLLEYEHAPTV
eukprot:1709021-Rhodomonas_salina.1